MTPRGTSRAHLYRLLGAALLAGLLTASGVGGSASAAGSLTMATDATIGPPFASYAADNKTIVGLDVDLAQALGRKMGDKVTVVQAAFGTLIPGLEAKRFDFSISAMLDTRAREQHVDFVDFIQDGSGFLVKVGSPNRDLTLAKLCGLKVAALSGSVEQLDVEGQSTKCTKSGKPAIEAHIFPASTEAILAVISGRVDAYDGDSVQNGWITKQNNGQVVQSGPAYGVAIDGMPVVKHSPLLKPLQKALQALMNDGTYRAILKKYGVSSSAITSATIDHALL